MPFEDWREEVFPEYRSPLVWLENGQARCDLAEFGLVPTWAANKPKFGKRTYNARVETLSERASYKNAWKKKQFGLALMQSFYEPNYSCGRPIRWRIKRSDGEPLAVASIYEHFVDHSTGEIKLTFSMLTINAATHPVMRQFHAPGDEKRSIVVVDESNYFLWLNADHKQAIELFRLVSAEYLTSEPAPRPIKKVSQA